MSHLALYRKWRPLSFDDVFGQNHITSALKTQVEQGRVSHAYLFTGTRGTGKTTCAKILARAACCENPKRGNPCNECPSCIAILQDSAMDVTEIDAASNNGVDNIREIRDEAAYAPAQLNRRVYIIDEVHMLSMGAFNALLKTLEEPPEHVLFILATTEIHKVPATILSRCQRYDFRRISPEVIKSRLQYIAEHEQFKVSDDAAAMLARLGDGSMRDAISLLDRSLTQGKEIDVEAVAEALGIATADTLLELFRALSLGDSARAIEIFTASYIDGRDIISLFDELLSLVRDLYILKTTGSKEYLMSACAANAKELLKLAQETDPALLEFFVNCISDLLSRLTRTAIRRTDAEICLMKMCLRYSAQPVQVTQPVQQPAAVAKKAEGGGEAPPWDTGGDQPQMQKEVRTEEPKSKKQEKKVEESAIKAPFITNMQGKVNSAVQVYLDYCDFSVDNGILNIYAPEEAMGFMEKPKNIEAYTQAAAALGINIVRLSKKGESVHTASMGLEDILSGAKSLGVNIQKP